MHKYKPKKESIKKSRDENLNNAKKFWLLRHLKMVLLHCLQNLSIKNRVKKKEEKKKDDLKEFSTKINKMRHKEGPCLKDILAIKYLVKYYQT